MADSSAPLLEGVSRLQKILAASGLESRRGAEQFIRDGRVTVNGRTAKLGDSADPFQDEIAFDGERLTLQTPAYWVLHKPLGVVTTARDPEGRPTVMDLLPSEASGVFPVGRLDIDTSGLLLLSNDGAMAQRLLHPSSGGEKEYEVTAKGQMNDRDVKRLTYGIVLDDGKTKRTQVSDVRYDPENHVTRFRLVMTEGRKRQIRRSMLILGHPVKKLSRIRIGPLRLGRLVRGQARRLRPNELEALKDYVNDLVSSPPRKGQSGPRPSPGEGARQRR